MSSTPHEPELAPPLLKLPDITYMLGSTHADYELCRLLASYNPLAVIVDFFDSVYLATISLRYGRLGEDIVSTEDMRTILDSEWLADQHLRYWSDKIIEMFPAELAGDMSLEAMHEYIGLGDQVILYNIPTYRHVTRIAEAFPKCSSACVMLGPLNLNAPPPEVRTIWVPQEPALQRFAFLRREFGEE